MLAPSHPFFGNKYRVLRSLGAGGMGSVWVAEDTTLKRQVAIKLITKDGLTDEARRRFFLEAQTAAGLSSPNIVQIFDFGLEEETPYLVMELLQGRSLAERLRKLGPLGAQEAEHVLRQVCRAAARAHKAGVVHRDLKPSNIFLVEGDEGLLVKLLDFGIAKSTGITGAAGHTLSGTFLGTPAYASPEQAQASKKLDHRSDIWSIGVIAFECLLGRAPFAGETMASIVLAVCARPLPIPSSFGPVPPGFDAWFARACARDPAERFQSAGEAAEALRPVLCPGAEPAPPFTSLAGAPAPPLPIQDTLTAATPAALAPRAAREPLAEPPGPEPPKGSAQPQPLAAPEPPKGSAQPAPSRSAGEKSLPVAWLSLGTFAVIVAAMLALDFTSTPTQVVLPQSAQSPAAPVRAAPDPAAQGEEASPASEPIPGDGDREGAGDSRDPTPEDCAEGDGACDRPCTGQTGEECPSPKERGRDGKRASRARRGPAARFEKACRAKSADACLALGMMYLRGQGVSRSEARASELFEAACAGGSDEGCVQLGRLLRPR